MWFLVSYLFQCKNQKVGATPRCEVAIGVMIPPALSLETGMARELVGDGDHGEHGHSRGAGKCGFGGETCDPRMVTRMHRDMPKP